MSTKKMTEDSDAASTSSTSLDSQTSSGHSSQQSLPLINDIVENYSTVIWKKVLRSMIDKIVDDYYKRGGFERGDTRETEAVQARAAIACALCERFRIIDVARSIEKDHSTVIYYRKKHQDNLKFWPGYAFMYALATDVMEKTPFIRETNKRTNMNSASTMRAFFEHQRRKLTQEANDLAIVSGIEMEIASHKSYLFDNLMTDIERGREPQEAIMDIIEEAIKSGIIKK